MANSNSTVNPPKIATTKFTLHGHRYELAQITARCWVVTSLQTGNAWQVAGEAGLKAWRRNASAWLRANRITVREAVAVSACNKRAAEFVTRIREFEPVSLADVEHKSISAIFEVERTAAKADSVSVTARRLGDVLANENQTMETKLEAK